jgi:hypothetical protein
LASVEKGAAEELYLCATGAKLVGTVETFTAVEMLAVVDGYPCGDREIGIWRGGRGN